MSPLTRTLLPALIAVVLAALTADAYAANSKALPAPRHDTATTTTTSRYPFLDPVKERLYKDTRRHHQPPPSASVSHQHHHGRVLPPATGLSAVTPSSSPSSPPPPPQSPLRTASLEHRRPYGFGQESDGGRHDKDGDEGDEDAEDDEDEDEDEDEEEGNGDSGRHHPGLLPELRGKSPWASAASTSTVRTPPAVAATPSPMSVYSQFKWEKMGRRQTLDEFKNSRVNAYKKPTYSAADAKEAQQHALRASRESVCKVPRPKVVHVSDLYPHHGKTYVPHCTVLHQCGADTGCCHAASHTCVARRSHRVELYFHSSTITGGTTSSSGPGSRYSHASSYPHTSNAVEKLVFYNHTECACHDTGEDLMPRDMAGAWPPLKLQPQPQQPLQGAAAPARHYPQHEHQHQHQHHQQHHHQLYQQQDTPMSRSSGGCRCPAEFSPRHFADAPCACDCFDKQRDCLRLKKGKDYFTHQDKLCIEKKQCQVPSCSYGAYSRPAGRCPRKQPPPPTSSAWGRHPPPPRRHSPA